MRSRPALFSQMAKKKPEQQKPTAQPFQRPVLWVYFAVDPIESVFFIPG
jgi:hypothetical protein